MPQVFKFRVISLEATRWRERRTCAWASAAAKRKKDVKCEPLFTFLTPGDVKLPGTCLYVYDNTLTI